MPRRLIRSRKKALDSVMGEEGTSKRYPKRPPNAYILYNKSACNSARHRGEIMPSVDVRTNWETLSEEEKARFEEAARKGFEEYRSQCQEIGKKRVEYDFETRCAPRKLKTLFSSETFDSRKKQFFREMGFEMLLEINCGKLRRSLCKQLVCKFDPNTCTLPIHGQTLKLTYRDVGRVLGIPAEGRELRTEGTNHELQKFCEEIKIKNWKKDVKLGDLERDLQREDVDEKEFKAKLLLYLIGWFLSPKRSLTVSTSYLYGISDVDKIAEVNWAKFVFDSLVRGVREYQLNGRVGISGCIYFLMVFYLSSIDMGSIDPSLSRTYENAMKAFGDSESAEIMQVVAGLGGLNSTKVKLLSVNEITPVWESYNTQRTDRLVNMEAKVESLSRDMEILKKEIAELKSRNNAWRQEEEMYDAESEPTEANHEATHTIEIFGK